MTSLPNRQSGVVLLVSLMLLLMLTILALTATNRSTLQERMAANSQDSNLAFQAAEAGRTAMFKKMDNIHSLLLSKSEGAALSGDKVDIDSMRYCAQMTKGPLVLYQRDGRVDSYSIGSVKTYVVFVDSQGTYSNDSNCDEALARHESGFAIKTL